MREMKECLICSEPFELRLGFMLVGPSLTRFFCSTECFLDWSEQAEDELIRECDRARELRRLVWPEP
jgi:hypothetical protein